MPQSCYDADRRDVRRVTALVCCDLLLAAACIMRWDYVAVIMAEPLSWAADRNVGSGPELLDYPYALMWLVPLAAAAAGWLAHRKAREHLACWLAGVPVLTLSVVIGWYYLTPAAWH